MTTMAKFHINAEGNAGKCHATAKCPFGSSEDHFDTADEARANYEAKQSVGMFAKIRQSKFLKNAVTAGAMTAVAVSLVGCSSIAKDDNATAPYDAPDQPVVSEPAPEIPTPDEIDKELNQAYEDSKDWVNKNGPGLTDKAKELWDELNNSSSPPASPSPSDTSGIYWQGKNLTPTAEEVASAQSTLDSLVVTSESSPQYDRNSQFGRAFQTGIAGEVEHRDVPTATFKNDSAQARVVDGHFIDPYTGLDVHVIGGESYDADLDHLVPLKEAWDSGASTWSQDKRVQLANDMDNLVYTASGVNRSKSDQDAAEFLPSYEPAQCIYAVSQISIKGKYQMSVDTAEKAALQQVISTRCTQ